MLKEDNRICRFVAPRENTTTIGYDFPQHDEPVFDYGNWNRQLLSNWKDSRGA